MINVFLKKNDYDILSFEISLVLSQKLKIKFF